MHVPSMRMQGSADSLVWLERDRAHVIEHYERIDLGQAICRERSVEAGERSDDECFDKKTNDKSEVPTLYLSTV